MLTCIARLRGSKREDTNKLTFNVHVGEFEMEIETVLDWITYRNAELGQCGQIASLGGGVGYSCFHMLGACDKRFYP